MRLPTHKIYDSTLVYYCKKRPGEYLLIIF